MNFDGVMLASPMTTIARTADAAVDLLAPRAGWVHELKADGIRAVVEVTTAGTVEIRNRRGVDITYRYPDVVATLQAQDIDAGIFDGEIVVMVDGRIDFPGIHKRDAQGSTANATRLSRTLPATFLAFDLLRWNDEPTTKLDLQTRRELLQDTHLTLMPQVADLRALWGFVVEQDMEGVVSKRLTSTYVAKRSRDWVKIKRTKTLSAIVSGYRAGRGQRVETFGALELSLIRLDGTMQRIGDVGSGFTRKDLEQIADNPTGFVVEVAYLDVSPTGTLRQPVFVALRDDVDMSACTTDQIADRVRSRATRQ